MHGLFYMFPLEKTYVSFRKSAEKSQITQQTNQIHKLYTVPFCKQMYGIGSSSPGNKCCTAEEISVA